MKKIVAIILSAAFALGTMASCAAPADEKAPVSSAAQSTSQTVSAPAQAPEAPRTAFRIPSLKGPTTMGIVKLMQDRQAGNTAHDYDVTMYGSPEEITPKLINGDIDVALIPANLASVLYNKTEGKIVVGAINTLGVLYMLASDDSVKTVADLKNTTIYTTGKGTTPEFVLNYILTQNGLDPAKDVNIVYKAEATEVAAAMAASSGYPIAMLPQPYVTSLLAQNDKMHVALDMTAEWNKVSPDSALVTGVMVARREFVEQNSAAFAQFVNDYAKSTEWVNANTDAAAALIAEYGIVPKAELAKKALPACNITFISGAEVKAPLEGYLKVLFAQNPQAIGGKLPDEAFYYNPA